MGVECGRLRGDLRGHLLTVGAGTVGWDES